LSAGRGGCLPAGGGRRAGGGIGYSWCVLGRARNRANKEKVIRARRPELAEPAVWM